MKLLSTLRDKRMEALSTALLRLPGYLFEWGMSKDARETARSLCEFFDSEIDRHRNEQEVHLFPALLANVQGRDRVATRDRLATFIVDHRVLEHAWKQLRPRLTAIGFGRPARLAIDEAARFAALYRNHVADEGRQLFAAAIGAEDHGQAAKRDPIGPRLMPPPSRSKLPPVA